MKKFLGPITTLGIGLCSLNATAHSLVCGMLYMFGSGARSARAAGRGLLLDGNVVCPLPIAQSCEPWACPFISDACTIRHQHHAKYIYIYIFRFILFRLRPCCTSLGVRVCVCVRESKAQANKRAYIYPSRRFSLVKTRACEDVNIPSIRLDSAARDAYPVVVPHLCLLAIPLHPCCFAFPYTQRHNHTMLYAAAVPQCLSGRIKLCTASHTSLCALRNAYRDE